MTGEVHIERVHPDLTGRPAGLATRAVAYVLDAVIAFGVYTGLVFLATFAFVLITRGEFQVPDVTVTFASVGYLVFYVVYLWYWWATLGKSPGKVIVGVRIVERDGMPVHRGRSLYRAIVYTLLPPPLVSWPFVLLTKDRRGFHDIVCRTRVVYDWGERPVDPKRIVEKLRTPS